MSFSRKDKVFYKTDEDRPEATVKNDASCPDNRKLCMKVYNYDAVSYLEKDISGFEEAIAFRDRKGVTWIDVESLVSQDLIEKLGTMLNLHPLTLEDILNTGLRPKIENFDTYLYIAFKMLYFDDAEMHIVTEQVSMILGEDYILTFQEWPGDVFEPLRNRLRFKKGNVSKLGADFLAYSLMDAVVDYYFVILEKIGERIEVLQDELVEHPAQSTLHAIHDLRNELIFLRKSVWPLREMLNRLDREETALIKKETLPFFRDVYVHAIQVMDHVDTARDIISGMLDIYLSSVSFRLSNVMKRLTVITTIFMPLTLLAGIGGMSEWSMMTGSRNWWFTYPLFFVGCGVIGILTYLFFKLKKWV